MTRKFLMIGSFASIYLLWGSTYLAIAVALQSIPPFALMGFRSLCGGLVLIASCGKRSRERLHALGSTPAFAACCSSSAAMACSPGPSRRWPRV